MVPQIARLMLLPLTSVAKLLYQREGVTSSSLYSLQQSCISRLQSILTIPSSTVAMLLVLHLCIYNKQYILKIDYLPYSIAKKLRLFQKIGSECNVFFILNCHKQNLNGCFIWLDAKPLWNCLLYKQTTLVSQVTLRQIDVTDYIHLLKLCQTKGNTCLVYYWSYLITNVVP